MYFVTISIKTTTEIIKGIFSDVRDRVEKHKIF